MTPNETDIWNATEKLTMMERLIASFHLRNAENEFWLLLGFQAAIREVHQGKSERSTPLSYDLAVGGGGHVICHGYDSSQPCIRSATIHSLDFFLQSYTDFTTAKIHDCYLSMEISNEWLLGGIESLSTLHQVGQIGRRNYQTR